MQDKAIMFSHEFNNFVQEAVGLDGLTPLQMPHDMGGEPNDDGPLRVKFILPHGPGVTHVEHDPGTARKALKKILSRNVPGREIEMLEEGQLLSSNGVFGVAINSGFTVEQRNLPGSHWIQGPCYLWFRVWEGSGNVYAVFISHANPGPHRARTVDVCRPNAAAPGILGQVMHAVNRDFLGGPGERLERFTPP
ncbi:hypothetical protein EV361DRAFT_538551 [Lentinula raphanica]|uniref:Uncharacterized protein n=1 Tax=Lentinula raphanica TaxID=153919 RepID=A0AA38PFN1_9AGAR|nr:hypothetical protein F5878DRAFT_639441 [Lentinula raphanica]KAJ3975193.1 hypothetical protein EV361DRAFT_538551 [Lentinula raphanica]